MHSPSAGSLKSWGARCTVPIFCLSGVSLELGVPSCLYGDMLVVGAVVEGVSAFLIYFDDVGNVVFSHSLMWRSGLASIWISFRGNSSVNKCRLIVSIGGGKFCRLLCPNLGQHTQAMFYRINFH